MNDATRARARTIAAIIRSMRVKRGTLSIASRLKAENLESFSEHLAKVYANATPTEAQIVQSLNLFAGKQPQCFDSTDQVIQSNRQRIATENTRKQVITDITRSVIKSLTPREKLAVANGEPLPRRFELKIYGGDDE